MNYYRLIHGLLLSTLAIVGGCGDSGTTTKYEEELLGLHIQSPTVPGQITIVAATSGTQINLNWAPSRDNGGIATYKLYRGTSVLTTPTSSFSDTGLTPAAQYCYRISAVDNAGNESGKSTQVCATTPDTMAPNQPTAVTLSVFSETQIDIFWSAPIDNVGVTGYRLYRNGVLSKTLTSLSTSDTGLLPFTQYCYKLSALDAAGNESALSASVCGTTLDTTQPSQPLNVMATFVSGTRIDLSWSPSADNIGVTGYNIYRGASYLKQVTGTSTSDIGLTPGTQYCYTVSAVDAVPNESARSAPICTTTINDTTPPTSPANLTLTAISATQLNLSWSPAIDNWMVASYTVYRDGIFLVSTLITAASDTGLAPNSNHCYTIQAVDGKNNISAPSLQACASTLADTTHPSTPGNLVATPISSDKISITWPAASDDVAVTSYNIYRGGTFIGTTPSSQYLDTGLNSVTTYCYMVSALDAASNESGISTQSCAITLDNKLSDTGQTMKYSTAFGDDSDYLANPPQFRDNGNGTVTDLISGLMWQQQPDSAAVRRQANSITFCSNLVLAGYSDWRLPSAEELMSIVNYGTATPAIDLTVFPTMTSGSYWTGDSYQPLGSYGWYANFTDGVIDTRWDTNLVLTQCVRGAVVPHELTDLNDGTITDNYSGLRWQMQDDGIARDWEQAISYCENLTLGGSVTWRLPNVRELGSIVNRAVYGPAGHTTFFTNILSSPYWSSTTVKSDASRAWNVNFYDGTSDGYSKISTAYVRCVQ